MSPFERSMLWGSAVLAGASGIALAVMKYAMVSPDPYAVVNHPLQPWVLKIHIVTSPLVVFAVGLVFVDHIWSQWRTGRVRGRVSGLWTLLTFAPMVLSGYLIQVVTARGWLSSMAIVHLVTGGAFLVGFAAHQIAIWLWVKKRKRDKLEVGLAAAPVTVESVETSASTRSCREP